MVLPYVQVLDYNGDRGLEAMVEYVESNGEKVSGDAGDEEVAGMWCCLDQSNSF